MLHSPLPFGIYEPSGMDKVGVHRVLTATLITFVTLKLYDEASHLKFVHKDVAECLLVFLPDLRGVF